MFFAKNADVPRGTSGFMRLISLFIITMCLLACNKPEKNPELKDPIYSSLNSALTTNNQAIEAEKKTLEEHQKTLEDVVPQTGQIKYAQKRVRESKERINRLEQESQYLQLKIKARAAAARKSYLAAFNKGESWPDPREWESYQTEQRLRNAKKVWDVQDRIKQAAKNEKPPAAAEGSGHH